MASSIPNKKDRQSNFELLRIVCILFIVAGHMILVRDWESSNFQSIIKLTLLPFFSVAVNCFVLISGWFSINLNWKKLWNLNTMVTFWAVLIGAFAIFFQIHELDVRKDILMLVPVLTKQYWFITIYFVLCIISPALNKLVGVLSQKELKNTILILISLFVLLPTLSYTLNFQSITNDAGFGLMNFIMLYLIGRYLKLYYKAESGTMRYLAFYIISMLLCGGVQIIYSRILGFEFSSFLCYDTIFCFIGSVALVLFFSNVSFQNKYINYLSTFCLATYIIHIHPWTFKWVYQDFFKGNELNDYGYIGFIFFMPVLTFVICVVLEYSRKMIFKLFINNRIIKKQQNFKRYLENI